MSEWPSFGKILMALGALLFIAGSLFFFGGSIPFLGKLPGDIRVERENFRFYFPLATCLILSLLLSLILWLFSKIK